MRLMGEPERPPRRCGHPQCSNCKTRRGRNRGNRRERHGVRAILRSLRKGVSG